MRVMKLIPVAALFLSACATGGSEPAPFPPLKEYSQEEQNQAADELDSLPAGSILPMFIADYGVLRAQVRAYMKETE